jgi:hypothetical protein
MPSVSRTRPRVGDVVEIQTSMGLAYAQYTHRHAAYGALLRVFPTLFATRPTDFLSVVTVTPQFSTFFPLAAACTRGIVHIVAAENIHLANLTFPTFRAGTPDKNGKIAWWLWDGERETRIGSLSPGMESFPIRGVINDTLLIERIVQGWRHEHVT